MGRLQADHTALAKSGDVWNWIRTKRRRSFRFLAHGDKRYARPDLRGVSEYLRNCEQQRLGDRWRLFAFCRLQLQLYPQSWQYGVGQRAWRWPQLDFGEFQGRYLLGFSATIASPVPWPDRRRRPSRPDNGAGWTDRLAPPPQSSCRRVTSTT